MGYTKRFYEAQTSATAANLKRTRESVTIALRAADEGSLDYFTVDAICRALIDALKHLSMVEDAAAGEGEHGPAETLEEERDYDAFQDADERNW